MGTGSSAERGKGGGSASGIEQGDLDREKTVMERRHGLWTQMDVAKACCGVEHTRVLSSASFFASADSSSVWDVRSVMVFGEKFGIRKLIAERMPQV